MSFTADVGTQTAFDGSSLVVIRNYPGRSQIEAAGIFAKEAETAARHGYLPTGQSWGEGRAGTTRVSTHRLSGRWSGSERDFSRSLT